MSRSIQNMGFATIHESLSLLVRADFRLGQSAKVTTLRLRLPSRWGYNLAPVLHSVSALLGQINRSSCPCGPAATHDLTSESLRGGVSLLGSPWHPSCF